MLVLMFGLINLVTHYQPSLISFLVFLSISLLIGLALVKEIVIDVKDTKFLKGIINNLLSYYSENEYKNKDEKIHSIIKSIFKVDDKKLRFDLDTHNIDYLLHIYNENGEKLMLVNLKYHTQILYCPEGYEIVTYNAQLNYEKTGVYHWKKLRFILVHHCFHLWSNYLTIMY